MFICETCAVKSGVDELFLTIAPTSWGRCEMCENVKRCCDIHHSKIPVQKDETGIYQIVARKEGDNIIIHKDSFEMLLACLDNQKFVGEAPPNGDALAMGETAYNAKQKEIQDAIDNINRQCRTILHQ